MKHFCLFTFLALNYASQILSQSYLGYYFIPTEYSSYAEIIEGTISSATGDDGAENINLPFPFKYIGVTYTSARISVNGWLEMGQTYTGTGAINELESTLKKPLICPLWDDLYADSQSEIRYETIGEYPARFFIVQWKNIILPSGYRKDFQIRLWELDGTIDFIYGPGPSNQSFLDNFSVGINNHIGGPGNFLSVTISDQYYYNVDTLIANNMNNDVSLLMNGMLFSFIPLYSGTRSPLLYQTSDSVIVGNPNQKIFAIIFGCHEGSVLTPPWVTKFNFNTNGTTNINDIQNAKLFYTGSYPYFSTNIQIGSAYPNPDGIFEIGGFSNYLNNNGLSYYWLAYDISPTATIGNYVDANCFRVDFEGCCPSLIPDSSLALGNCIIIDNSLPTILSIGLGGNYTSITEALQDLQNQTISTPHIFELLDTYETTNETFPIDFPYIEGSSQTNTITIRPAINAADVFLISDTTIFVFHYSTYTTIDGRPGGVVQENHISMTNNSTNSSTILFYDGAQFNSIKNCNIYGSDERSGGGVVLFDATSYSNSNNTLADCLITNAENYLPANIVKIFNSYSGGGSHHKIERCEIKNFTRAGIEIYSADHSMLVGNLIYNDNPVQSDLLYGINNYGKYVTISRCKIYNLNSSLNESNEILGINILRAYSGIIDNNFISLSGNDYSTIYGIFIKGELFFDNYYFFYNSINIFGNCANSSKSYCFNRVYTLADNIEYNNWYLKNNIFINKRTNVSGNGIHLAIAVNDPYYSAEFDCNDYYVDPTNNYLALWMSSYAPNIEEWRLLSSRDFNSVSKSVDFASNIDLHLTGSSLGDTLLIATPLPDLITDIDYDLRHPLYPYKGADESTDYPLPVELLTFTASVSGNSVILNWSTASELNNRGFEIERNKLDWESIGFVQGGGTTTGIQTYSFIDENLTSGKYQYRLKQIDFDGTSIYSKTIEVDFGVPNKFSLEQNYPNPFNPNTKISWQSPIGSWQTLKVYDILGNVVATLVNEYRNAGSYDLNFDASKLSSGVYFYRLQAGDYIEIKKMLILK